MFEIEKAIKAGEVEKLTELLSKETSIDLRWNQIGDKGAIALAEAIKDNQSLNAINLYGNQIGIKGATALAEAIRFSVQEQ